MPESSALRREGEVATRYYKFKFLFDGEPIWTTEQVFVDDLDALDEARMLAVAHDVQIWYCGELIAYVKEGDAPMGVADPKRI